MTTACPVLNQPTHVMQTLKQELRKSRPGIFFSKYLERAYQWNLTSWIIKGMIISPLAPF